MTYDIPVSRLTPVRMHFVVVLPISTDPTIKYGLFLYSGIFMPAPWVMDGGGGLSTICGLGFMNREKKLGHIYSESCLALHISFCLVSLTEREANQEKNASAFFDMMSLIASWYVRCVRRMLRVIRLEA
jgi:hypothetical protein